MGKENKEQVGANRKQIIAKWDQYTFNINGLTPQINDRDFYLIVKLDKKARPICCIQKAHFRYKNPTRLKVT